MINKEPVRYVEIDLDQCDLVWGVGACTAVLSALNPNKCRNTWNTCPRLVKENYSKSTLTLRFIEPRAKMPIDGRTFFPTLKSVSSQDSTVNIVGFNQKLGTLGRRATVSVNLSDHPYNDSYTDPYYKERISGDAQFDSVGYNPFENSTFWNKLRLWSPNYADRPLRVIDTHIVIQDDGTAVWDDTDKTTNNFIMTNMAVSFSNNQATITGKDVITLAEKESAVAPAPSSGILLADIGYSDEELTLTPEGIGDLEYDSSGVAVIGSEIVKFTRVGDTITLTERAAFGSSGATHSEGDTFQKAIHFEDTTLNGVIQTLLEETDIDPSFYDLTEYSDEVTRWGSTIKINTVLTTPTAVTTYLGELVTLGASLWWDGNEQLIKLKLNHPLDYDETVVELSDDGSIKSITEEDKDDERITQVHFYSVQSNPTASVTNKSNYDRIKVIYDGDAQNTNSYGSVRIKEVFCRWLNTGNSSLVNILGRRYLQRFSKAPTYHTIVVDNSLGNLSLTDVVDLVSQATTDVNGFSTGKLSQIIGKTQVVAGHEVKYTTQSYEYKEIQSFIMANDANDYSSATDQELALGCYIGDETLEGFSDGNPFDRIM